MEKRRFLTREVKVGDVGVGADNPVRIQSMTTSNTRDAEATAEQIIRLADAGCEIARVTVQGKKEALACEEIKNLLTQKGYTIPLVADIHFYPPAAMLVADFVDKVRVNPGNYVDRRASFKTIEYDDKSYASELLKIEEGFTPLVLKLKAQEKALRIGTNHGSLSDRIMNRYGDTPAGMVESAFEFVRVCRKNDFHNIIFSMKASNPLVMIEAYRLLVTEMENQGWNYPLHLGVTEAGEGEDGRVKSAVGIGSLLLDGIGDTIRVSLTEDPWLEIDPCKRLVQIKEKEKPTTFFKLPKRKEKKAPLHRDGTVILKVDAEDLRSTNFLSQIGAKLQLSRPEKSLSTVDALYLESLPEDLTLLNRLSEIGIAILSKEKHESFIQVLTLEEAKPSDGNYALIVDSAVKIPEGLNPLFILFTNRAEVREFVQINGDIPLILAFDYDLDEKDLVIRASAEMGSLLCDGMADGIFLKADLPVKTLHSLSFNLLQACRMRTVKTEFISCPSCGRTLFNLQEVSRRIREKTDHLPGVKIAIMGCIVNGPGEMADADFGYVGSRPGKIDLYVGKECVEKNIEFDDADERLIELIKAHGRWVEPEKELACTTTEK